MDEDQRRKDLQKSLDWCQEQREHALATIKDYQRGRRDYVGLAGGKRIDVTEKHKAQYEKIVSNMDKLILAYEALLDA